MTLEAFLESVSAPFDANAAWEKLRDSNPPKGQALHYYKDNREYFIEGFRAHAKDRAKLEVLVSALKILDPLVQNFGDDSSDVFEQMIKGGWRDEHGHDVEFNSAMVRLKETVIEAIEARQRISALLGGESAT